jgi:Na+/proline symporter
MEISSGLGYIVLIGFGLLFFGTSALVSRKFPIEGVDDFVAAGRSIPFALIAASVMVSWVWTTTIMGAAEAGMWFGVSGGLNYSWGAVIPFFVFIPLVIHLRRIMPRATTFTEFIEQRFGKTTKNIFFVFGIGVILYVFVEQGVGIGIAFSNIFGIPYEVAAFLSIMIVTFYIARAGLRGSIFNDLIQFFVIALVFLVTTPLVLNTLGIDFIYKGLVDVATNPNNVNYNPEALSLLSGAGFRYGIAAVVIAMGQVLLDQGYYSKAISAVNTKSLLYAYLIGTIFAWAPIPIISGNIFGNAALAMGLAPGHGINLTTEVSPYILKFIYGGGIGSLFFILMVFMAGMTTGGNCLAGAQALFTVDFYKNFINKKATEEEQMRFGRKITIILGILVGIAAVLLEGVSLLKLDIFSGILFAAPCSAFFAGMFWKKPTAPVAIVSIFAGLISGLCAWFFIENQDINWFVGNVLSLCVPAVVIVIGSAFGKDSFDFAKLKEYQPSHKVHI